MSIQSTRILIVYVPTKDMLKTNPQKIERTIRSLKEGVPEEILPHIENPKLILTSERHLSEQRRQVRRANLDRLRQGFFGTLVLAGSGISEYVRAIVRSGYQSPKVDVSLYVEESSVLGRYIRWFHC